MTTSQESPIRPEFKELTDKDFTATMTFTGGTLTLQAVSADALRYMERKYHLDDFFQSLAGDPEQHNIYMDNLDDETTALINEGVDVLMNYCAIYGVRNEPSADAIEELEMMGVIEDNPKIRKLSWLRLMVLGHIELSIVSNAVRTLTFAREQWYQDKMKERRDGKNAG